ncbi:MAG: PAS domain S-box protein [Cytophaga sp.]|uniref:PAS domain S-box protein n=1 Tax=Cytophaga sp. TaxID=29535 RepID=UPI003F80DA55
MKGKSDYLSLYIDKTGVCKYIKCNSDAFGEIIDTKEIEGKDLKSIFKRSKFSETLQACYDSSDHGKDFCEHMDVHQYVHYLISFQPIESQEVSLIITIRLSDISKKIDLLKNNFESALSQSKVGLWVWYDMANDKSWWSDSFLNLLGYSRDEISPSMKAFMQLIHPEQKEDFIDRMRVLYSAADRYEEIEEKRRVEFKVQTKQGSYIDLLFTVNPIKNEKNELIKFSGTVVDIGQMKIIEEKLLKSETTLHLALDAANMGVWSWDITKDQIFWSNQVLDIFHIKKDDFKGDFESYLNLIPTNERNFVANSIQEVLKNGSEEFSFEHSIYIPTGNKKIVFCKGKLYRDEQDVPHRMTGVVIDVSQENDLKAMLGQTKGKYKSVIESMVEGVIILDKSGKIIDHNKAALLIIGYEDLELIGNDLTFGPGKAIKEDFSLFPYEEFPGTKTLLTGTPCKNVTLGWVKPSKEIIWLSINSEPVLDENGALIAVVCSYFDVTERYNSIQDLQVKNRQLEDFAHITSHNLRSPISNLSILLDYFEAAKDETERKEYFSNLKHVSNSLLSTIQVLAEALKIQRDFVDDEIELSFQETLDSVLGLLSGQIKEANVAFEVDFSKCDKLFYSQTYLHSIFINLISNAIKYRSPQRETIIKIDSYKSDNGKVVLKISDNGIGIDIEKNQHKIFGLYKTFHANKDSRGVGLYMTKRQIETLGGAIFVESKINVGTTFTIIF